MSVLSVESIRVLDEMFREGEQFLRTGDFVNAYGKYDDIKRSIEAIQSQASVKTSNTFAVGGAILGLVVPGIGNFAGFVSGAVLGRYVGSYIAKQSFRENGTIEEIREIAIVGKQETKAAQRRKYLRSKGKLPESAPILNTGTESIYSRWQAIQKEVL